MARLLNRLLLIALAKGKLPMNEYAVVKEQAKGEVQKEHLSPIVLKPWGCQPCSVKKFFNFPMANFKGEKDYQNSHEFASLGILSGNRITRLNQCEAIKYLSNA